MRVTYRKFNKSTTQKEEKQKKTKSQTIISVYGNFSCEGLQSYLT